MRPLSVVLLAAALAGCSEDDAPATCPTPRGTFLISYVERSGGTCGPIEDRLYVNDEDAVSGGSGTLEDPRVSVSPDNCEVSVQQTYTVKNKDGVPATFEETVTARNAKDGQSATAVFVLKATGGLECRSTYDVTYTRQLTLR